MIQVNLDFSDEQFRTVLREEIKNAIADVVQQNQLPPLLSIEELMQLLRIKRTKASELLNKAGFPVLREAGVLIPTHLLFKWIDRNSGWVEENTNYYKAI